MDAVCEVEIGRTLGADAVVSGEVIAFAGEYRLILKVHDCQSAAFMTSETVAATDLTELESKVADAAWPIALRLDGRRPPRPAGTFDPAPVHDPFGTPPAGVARAVTPALIRVDAGEFLMGSPPYRAGRDDIEDRHQVTLTQPFLIGVTEVTQMQWFEVMGSWPSYFEGANRPVEKVDWFDAIRFCNALSRREGLTPAYWIDQSGAAWNQDADGYRLPTEAEWEYACRAGARHPMPPAKTPDGCRPWAGSGEARGMVPAMSRASSPTPGACMTCTAMCGNGAGTGAGTTRRASHATRPGRPTGGAA